MRRLSSSKGKLLDSLVLMMLDPNTRLIHLSPGCDTNLVRRKNLLFVKVTLLDELVSGRALTDQRGSISAARRSSTRNFSGCVVLILKQLDHAYTTPDQGLMESRKDYQNQNLEIWPIFSSSFSRILSRMEYHRAKIKESSNLAGASPAIPKSEMLDLCAKYEARVATSWRARLKANP
ncbi:hypothetical protein HAX54_005010 [Datura stramonium]|uniref:Uncharacterized protein n=1 Tax=Datura stramonium TaxID=4076 RepID=A0ABS8RU39_DATST|nr:hypothetical protein [Datura stramonium]